jgi:integrase
MATIKLIVKSTEKGQPATIYLRFRDGRKTDIIISTPERVFPEYWNNKSQSFKQRILFNKVFTEKDKTAIEEKFSQMKDSVLKEHNSLNGKDVSKEWLKSVIDKFNNKNQTGAETLNQYFQRFIDEALAGIRLSSNHDSKRLYSPHTMKSIKGFQSQLNEYQGIYTEKALKKLSVKNEDPRPLKIIDFEDITIDFYNELVNYFYSKKYSPNTIGKHVKTLKGLMRQAREEGLTKNTESERKSFKSIRELVQNIYLSESELRKLYELDLSDNSTWDLARDVFLIGCYTAQRFSDYSRISSENIRTMENGKRVIDLIQQKTGEKVTIPIRHELETILKKYNYVIPRSYEQKVNDRIKKIGLKAGITESVRLEKNKGGMIIKTDVQKCDLIVTHTARRSGCTNMYLAGIPTIDIMKISGHKTEREFLKYIKVSKEETAINLSNHPFFVGNTLSIAK